VCALAASETGGFSPERCAAMLARYQETATSALRFVEGKKALTARQQLTPHGPTPSLGPDDAPMTIILFSDFSDDNCGRASPVVTAIKNLYADRVRFVFRQFPSRLRADAYLTAQASLAAHAQGRFWAYHDILFGNPQARDRAALERYAREIGLDLVRFRRALDRHIFAADVDADVELGRKLNLDSVPAMFVNGRSVRVPYGVDELARVIATASAAKP
jgi:protein-disulfide isomerase